MSQSKSRSVVVKETTVTVTTRNELDYISHSDMVRNFEGQGALIENWLRANDTVLFLGVWEQLNNPVFNSLEFEGTRNEAGRYGGTFAHRDIAFEFGSWLSPEFKLYLIKEFQRLKDDEAHRISREWSFQRTLAKVNHRIHTDAIQEHLIPPALTKAQIQFVYASEADLLNVALFGMSRIVSRGAFHSPRTGDTAALAPTQTPEPAGIAVSPIASPRPGSGYRNGLKGTTCASNVSRTRQVTYPCSVPLETKRGPVGTSVWPFES